VTCRITASVKDGIGGTISPSGTVEIPNGGTATFTIRPSTGFSINDVLVDGTSVQCC